MPDYSKTQIYKIVSKDSSITNFYIGSTTNWTKRKQEHKCRCNTENNKKCNLKIYEIMRENGGFENFNMILVEDFPCKNRREAEKREQYWKDLLKPDMNMINCANYEFTKKMNLEEYYKEKYEKELLKNPDYAKENYQKYNYKVTCECGSEIIYYHLWHHKKTLKHKSYIESLNNEQPPTNPKITV